KPVRFGGRRCAANRGGDLQRSPPTTRDEAANFLRALVLAAPQDAPNASSTPGKCANRPGALPRQLAKCMNPERQREKDPTCCSRISFSVSSSATAPQASPEPSADQNLARRGVPARHESVLQMSPRSSFCIRD